MDNPSNRASFGIFLTSAIVLISGLFFFLGLLVGKLHIWPYDPLRTVYQHARSYLVYGDWAPENQIVPAPSKASRQRLVVHDRNALMPGYRAIMGWDRFSKRHAIWLFDERGREIHKWRIDYSVLDPDGPLNGDDTPHGMKLLRDGSALVNFDHGDVLARIDACGRPIWIRKGVFHHSLESADDGSYWTWRGDGSSYAHYQYLVNFNPETGDTIAEFSLIDDFIKRSKGAAMVFGIPEGFPYRRFDRDPRDKEKDDIFHPNDVEPLPAELAGRFPMFRTGDLLVSLRTGNLVAVLDPRSRTVRWWSHGPWIGQHDADFGPDGRIWIFNNNTYRGRSVIVAIDPRTGAVANAYPESGTEFYSAFMGKHQLLPNGSRNITIPGEGRSIEISRDGKLIFEFNNIYNDKMNAHVQNSSWISNDYFKNLPSCG